MEIKIHQKDSFKQSKWTGGITTELYIFPQNAAYSQRNFSLRISTAAVESEESVFTYLPGVDRLLMPLKGSIYICHEGHYSKELKPLDIDSFKGGWLTKAVGSCIDFNVMTIGDVNVKLSSYIVKEGYQRINIRSNYLKTFIYAFSGDVEMKNDQKSYHIKAGELVEISQLEEAVLSFLSSKEVILIVLETS